MFKNFKMKGKILKTGKKRFFEILKNLDILSLVVVGIILMMSENVNAYNNSANGICECGGSNVCSDCTNALNDSSCNEIKLNTSIINHTGNCINNPANFNNKIFDCQGYTIEGNGVYGGWPDAGIYLNNKQNNTIKNCIITDFERGIYLGWNSNNNTLANNTANSNSQYGIYLDSSSNNTLTSNTANTNTYGIFLDYSSNNNLTSNNLTNNKGYSLFDYGNNGCNYADLSNIGGDIGKPIRYEHDKTGITIQNTDAYSEIIFCNVNNSVIDNITISNPGTTSDGILLVRSNNNLIKNSNLHNDGWGIYLFYSSNNTLANNTANSNRVGIFLYSSSYNTLINNTANSNNYGIYLGNADNNNFTSNTANFNQWHGFCAIYGSTSNQINQNRFCSNNQSGEASYDIYDLDSNIGDDNTCGTVYNYEDIGSASACKNVCPTKKACSIFDAVEMLEYLNGDKNLTNQIDYYNLYNKDDVINLLDVLTLIDKIVIGEMCVEEESSSDIKNLILKIKSISLEKTSYTANELIRFNVTIKSNMDVNNVSVHVYGITSRQGSNLIEDIKILNLTKGTTMLNYVVASPPCTHGCGGKYYPGDYPLYAEVKYENKSINFTLSDISSVDITLY